MRQRNVFASVWCAAYTCFFPIGGETEAESAAGKHRQDSMCVFTFMFMDRLYSQFTHRHPKQPISECLRCRWDIYIDRQMCGADTSHDTGPLR